MRELTVRHLTTEEKECLLDLVRQTAERPELLDDFDGQFAVQEKVSIRFGPLLLRASPGGEQQLELWVLSPGDAPLLGLTPVGPPRVVGLAVPVSEQEEGVWWDYLGGVMLPALLEALVAGRRRAEEERRKELREATRSVLRALGRTA
jgi:hypothetical protein